jgi:FlaG/FlaF family flagellin (archaellin)
MNAKDHPLDESAVSPVIGEMLMIVLALLLVSLFSVTLLDFLPSERSAWVDIKMNNSCENVTLWHKGGDWAKKSDLRVVIIKGKQTFTISSSDESFILEGNSFDLGDTITVRSGDITFDGGEIVRLVSERSVVFSGVTAPPT